MTIRLCFIMLLGLAAASCSGSKKQGIQTPAPTPQVTEPAGDDSNDPLVNEDDPFANINDEQVEDDSNSEGEIQDPNRIDGPLSSNISSNPTVGGGASALTSMLPLITGLLSGRTPDIGSILGLLGGGGGGGGLGGLTGLIGQGGQP